MPARTEHCIRRSENQEHSGHSLKEKGRNSLLSVKVADYGLVRTKRKSMSFVSRQARKLDVVQWKAPENLERLLSQDKDETSSESDLNSDDECVGASDRMLLSADVYSFFVTCSEILTGEDPYPHLNWKELGARIVSGTLRPKLPAACPSLLKGLLVSCWDKDHDQRPSFSHICKMLELILLNPQEWLLPSKDHVPILNAATKKASTEEAVSWRWSRGKRNIFDLALKRNILGLAPKKRTTPNNPELTSSSDATTDWSENSEFSGFSGTSWDGSAELRANYEYKFPVRLNLPDLSSDPPSQFPDFMNKAPHHSKEKFKHDLGSIFDIEMDSAHYESLLGPLIPFSGSTSFTSVGDRLDSSVALPMLKLKGSKKKSWWKNLIKWPKRRKRRGNMPDDLTDADLRLQAHQPLMIAE